MAKADLYKRLQENMHKFFNQYARIHKNYIQNMIQNRKGAAGDQAPTNAQTTIRSKGFNHWLKDSGALKKSGFSYIVYGPLGKLMGYEVYTKNESHPNGKGITYQEIMELWGRGNPRGKRLQRYSGVFSQMPQELWNRFYPALNRKLGKETNIIVDEYIREINRSFK